MAPKKSPKRPLTGDEFFEAAHVSRKVVEYAAQARIFAQGDAADTVIYIRQGTVKLAVVSKTGKEAVVALPIVGTFSVKDALLVRGDEWRRPPPSRP